jgi:hypothetical protein
VTAKTPRLPRIPPRSHHQKATTKTPFFAKSPAKHHNSPPQTKSAELFDNLLKNEPHHLLERSDVNCPSSHATGLKHPNRPVRKTVSMVMKCLNI